MKSPPLSPREVSVLHLMAFGLSNQGVAAQLHLSVKTVESACRSIFLKLGLTEEGPHENRRVQAVLRYQAMRQAGEVALRYLDPAGLIETTMLDAGGDAYDAITSELELKAERADQPWAGLAFAAWCAVIGEDLDRAADLAARARASADRFGAIATAITDGLIGVVAAFAGDAPLDAEALDTIAGLARQPTHSTAGTIFDTMDPILEFANWFVYADRYGDAAIVIQRARHHHDELDRARRETAACAAIEMMIRRGRWAKALALVAPVIATETADFAGYPRTLAARAAAMGGEFDVADEHLRVARRSAARRSDLSTERRIVAAAGLVELRRGNPDAAVAALASLADPVPTRVAVLPSLTGWQADLVDALARLGRDAEATEVSADLRRIADATASPWGRSLADRAEGIVAVDHERRLSMLTASAAGFAVLGAQFERARSLEWLSTAHCVAGDEQAAARAHVEASDLLRALAHH